MLRTEFKLDNEALEKINAFTRRTLTADEVYAFPIILCDNEIDRDCERFSLKALQELSQMLIGKTGIFDHNPKGENQTARIFDAEVLEDSTKKTQAGENYTAVVGRAYMVRTNANESLIAEIDAGIKKEVSISCSISKKMCSICGNDKAISSCSHIRGKSYSGRLCHDILDAPTDAYEWSFVAIPAQRNAGITKGFEADSGSISKEPADERESLICEVTKRLFLLEPQLPVGELRPLVSLLDTDKLDALKLSLKALSRKGRKKSSPTTKKELNKLLSYKL